MALIQCPECQHNVSDKAMACPKCGFPVVEYLPSILNNKESFDIGNQDICFSQDKAVKSEKYDSEKKNLLDDDSKKEALYNLICKLEDEGSLDSLYKALNLLGKIPDYKDSKEKKSKIQTIIYEKQKKNNLAMDKYMFVQRMKEHCWFGIVCVLSIVESIIAHEAGFLLIPVILILINFSICLRFWSWKKFSWYLKIGSIVTICLLVIVLFLLVKS